MREHALPETRSMIRSLCAPAAVLFLAAAAHAQSITIEKAELAAGSGTSTVRGAATLDLPAGTIVDVEIHRPGVTPLGTITVDAPGRKEFSFGPLKGKADTGLYPLVFVARREKQTDAQVKAKWGEEGPPAIEGTHNILVGKGEEAEKAHADRRMEYGKLLYSAGGWYQQMTGRVEGAIQRAQEIEQMSKADPMRLDHFRKTLWNSAKNESTTGENLLKPIHRQLLVLKDAEKDRFAPIFGNLPERLGALEDLLKQWLAAIMKEAQAVYEQLYPPAERTLQEPHDVVKRKRLELEAKIKEAVEPIYQLLGAPVLDVWTMKETVKIDRGWVDNGIYENMSCRFHVGPLPKGLRFNIFSTDPETRVFLESDANPDDKETGHFAGTQGSVIVRQFPMPLASDAFTMLLKATNEGLEEGREIELPDKLMPDRKRKGIAFRQAYKFPGSPARPAGEYEGIFYLVYGRDMRTVYIFQVTAPKKTWPKVGPAIEEVWKTFRIRDEEPPELIQLIAR